MNRSPGKSIPKVLAISSGGGHWVELLRVLPALEGTELVFATVNKSYRQEIDHISGRRFYRFQDVTRWNKVRWLQTAFQILWIIVRERPSYIVSTGALPGYMALRLGKYFGAKTIWIDSIANVETLSASGRRIGKYADLWLTQWQHLAGEGGPEYYGAVI
jgi:exopolysaccharide biosynthesis glucuronosyltransferase PssD